MLKHAALMLSAHAGGTRTLLRAAFEQTRERAYSSLRGRRTEARKGAVDAEAIACKKRKQMEINDMRVSRPRRPDTWRSVSVPPTANKINHWLSP